MNDTLLSSEHVGGTPNADNISVAFNFVASIVQGRDGDDTLSTDDGDNLDLINGGAGTNTCSTADGDTLIDC